MSDVIREGTLAAPEDAALLPASVNPELAKPLLGRGGRFRFDDKGARRRRKLGAIRAYVGVNGAGKSLAMLHDSWYSIREGRPILSTVRILDPRTGGTYENYIQLRDWSQLLEAEHCDVLFDEVQGIANSRASQGMPVQVQTFLHQLRRRDITLSWSSPSWARADLLLREVTRIVTVCRGYFPERSKAGDEDENRVWGANTLFRWLTYDSQDFTTWSDSSEGKLKGKVNAWVRRPALPWVGRPMLAQELYDSLDAVDRIGDVLDSGRCVHCGGTRTPAKCSCDDYVNRSRKQNTDHGHAVPQTLDAALVQFAEADAPAPLPFPTRRDARATDTV